ncbi:phage major tail tube protein [Sulfurimonas sp.]|uniref:phage major tail tube protein n=1 Tax=Sulfurimonas sp. TaxID=2022749 RepID=UPI0025F9E54F|nr:phage major tail tube protein [Sulfurimonas sp.]
MAGIKLPETVVDCTVFVNGIGKAGVTDKDGLKLPDIEEIEETVKAGGFEQSYGTGVFKKLDFEVVIKEIDQDIYVSVGAGLASGLGVNLTIKGSTIQDGVKKPFVATIQGKPSISQKGAETTLKGTATIFGYEYDGVPLCMFDTKNMIGMIGGVDYLATLRSHIL